MKRIFLIFILIALIVVSAFIAAGILKSDKEVVTGSAVKNPALVEKMESLYKTNLQRDLTLNDLNGLNNLVKDDSYALEELEELRWFIENKETLHISHSINALEVYASTGKKSFCITDAMSHLRVYIKHNEAKLLADSLVELPAELDKWRVNIKSTQASDPSYFKNFDDINKRVNGVVQRIKNGDRSKQVSSDLYYIETYGVC